MEIRGKQIIFFFVMVFIGMVLVGLYFIIQSNLDDFNDKVIDVDKLENKQTGDSGTSSTDASSEQSVIPAGADTSGGGGSSGGADTSGLTCVEEPITYSIINQNKNQSCLTMNGEICEESFVNCTATIENRDDASSEFEIELYFLENGKLKADKFDGKIEKFNLLAGEKFIFKDYSYLASTGLDGIANKNINCFFVSLKFPMKEICS